MVIKPHLIVIYIVFILINKITMQTKSVKQKVQPTWSRIVQYVEGANLKQSANSKIEETNRKRAYKSQLEKQIQQNQKNKVYQQFKKSRERTELEEKVIQQKHNQVMDKYKKMKTQQKYGIQNLEIARTHKDDSGDTRQYKQSPFASLIEKQQSRNKQTRMNFQLQNRINEIQVKMHRNRSLQQKEEESKIKKQFQNYVQNQFYKKEKERESFKHKYLMHKKWECNGMVEPVSQSVEKSYIQFLNQQVQQLKNKRYKQKQGIQGPLSQINKHAEIPDSSPAYLGRAPYSSDRRKQLDILDNTTFGRSNAKKIRSGSQTNNRQCANPMSASLNPNLLNEVQKRRANTTIKILNPISKINAESLQQIDKPNLLRKSSQFQSLAPITKAHLQMSKSLVQPSLESQLKQAPRERRSYFQYNFITGDHKTFFV